MQTIKTHVAHRKIPPVRRAPPGETAGSNAVEAAILKGIPTRDIMASTHCTNSMVQAAKRKLRNMGRL